jgi:hypothetical protein
MRRAGFKSKFKYVFVLHESGKTSKMIEFLLLLLSRLPPAPASINDKKGVISSWYGV